jgi:hypothetical protein
MKLTITIPATPSKLLAPNKARTVHYLAKAEVSRPMRELARYTALAQRGTCGGGPIFRGAVRLTETIYWGRGERRVDLSAIPSLCKPYEDGLTDANIWIDDSQVTRLIVEQYRAANGIGQTVLEVTDGIDEALGYE